MKVELGLKVLKSQRMVCKRPKVDTEAASPYVVLSKDGDYGVLAGSNGRAVWT